MYATYVYAAVSVLAASIILFGYWFHRRRELGADAVDEWEERSRSRTKTVKGVDRETFLKIYVSGHEPRWALYACGTLLIALLTTPVIGVALMMLWPIIVLGLDGGPWYDVGYYPWMFYMFFGMCFSWAGVAFLMARLHHARRPEPFNAALARARGEPLDEVVIPRKRPAWAKKVRPLAKEGAQAAMMNEPPDNPEDLTISAAWVEGENSETRLVVYFTTDWDGAELSHVPDLEISQSSLSRGISELELAIPDVSVSITEAPNPVVIGFSSNDGGLTYEVRALTEGTSGVLIDGRFKRAAIVTGLQSVLYVLREERPVRWVSVGSGTISGNATCLERKGELRMQYLHTMVRVTDIDASLRFYRDGLGLKECSRYDSEGGRFTLIFLATDEDIARAGFKPGSGKVPDGMPCVELTHNWDPEEYGGGRNFGHLAYRVENIYEICAHLDAMGYTINRPPRDGHMAFVRSPDGISVELLQRGDKLAPQEPWASMDNTGSW